MKIAVLGGSFSPIHIGHLALADEVCTALHYDKLLFIPAYRPPHKELSSAVTAMQRLRMVQLACEDDERFVAEDCEVLRQGVSYTYDTVCLLEKKYGDVLEGKIGLVMGNDLLKGFHLWYRAKEISEKCDLILAKRPQQVDDIDFANKVSGEFRKLDSEENFLEPQEKEYFAEALYIGNAELQLSSTDIRSRIGRGRCFKYLVPPKVYEYIAEEKLYGYGRC